MKTLDIIAEILKIEGVNYLSAFPTTNMIESAAKIGIKPIICRQERAGVGIADGFSRINNGSPLGVFAMQYGPGAENAYSGIATAYSDSVPMLLLPLGHPTDRDRIFPNFSCNCPNSNLWRKEKIYYSKRMCSITKFPRNL